MSYANLKFALPLGLVFALTIFALTVCAECVGQETASDTATDVDTPKPASQKGRWGYIDRKGQFVIKAKYFAAEPFKEELALVVTRGSWLPLGSEFGELRLAQITYIDRSGREIRPPLSVRFAESFSDGLALVVPDTLLRARGGCAKGGYLNRKGEWAIGPQYDAVTGFSEGLAAVNLGANCGLGGKWGYVDKNGQTAIPFQFFWAGQFKNGRACVAEVQGKTEVIDHTGRVIPGESCS
jgi:hypothetical protein